MDFSPFLGLGKDLLAALIVWCCLMLLLRLWFPSFRVRHLFNRRAIRAVLRGGTQYIFGARGQRRVHGWRLLYRMRTEMILKSKIAMERISRFTTAKVWIDTEAFPRVLKLIRRARHTIFIQMFIWKDDKLGRTVAQALIDAADRGVHVEISKEKVGDVFEFHKDFLGTKDSTEDVWWKFWRHKNIRITHATRNDHGKVFIIDERIFLLTGMNIADEYHGKWHDYMVELHGRSFVEHYLTGSPVRGSLPDAQIVMNTEQRKDIRPVLMNLLENARHSIVLEQCYFSDPAVIDLLIRKSKTDVTIIVILPAINEIHYYANMQAINRLLNEGNRKKLSVFLYPRVVHGKIVMTDRQHVFIGSANLMTTSLDDMGEVNVLLHGKHHRATKKLRDVLKKDLLESEPVSRPVRLQWLWRWLTWVKL